MTAELCKYYYTVDGQIIAFNISEAKHDADNEKNVYQKDNIKF